MGAEDTERLLSLLHHWHEPLRKAVQDPFPTESETQTASPFFWLQTNASATIGIRELEALELYALLVQTTTPLWRRVAKQIWPDLEAAPVAVEAVGISLRVRGGFDELRLLTAPKRNENDNESDASATFDDVRDLLRSIRAARGVVVSEISVRLCFAYDWRKLTKVVEIVGEQHAVRQAAQAEEYKGLCIRAITFDDARPTLTLSALRLLLEAATYNVQLSDFGLIKHDVYRDEPSEYVKALQTFFRIDHTADTDDARLQGVEEVKLEQKIKVEMIPSVFSAIRACGSARTIKLDLSLASVPVPDRKLLFSWMAYALFRQDQHSTSSNVHLMARVPELTQDDIASMQGILNASDPLAVLIDRDATLSDQTISAKRFSLHDPTIKHQDDLPSSSYESVNVLHGLSLLQCSQEWWVVLLPGWGRAWVHSDDVVDHHRGRSTETTPVVKVLTLTEVTGASLNAVLLLLEQVGDGLESLTIIRCRSRRRPYISDAILSRILTACPRLAELDLGGMFVESLRPILDSYSSGGSKLRRLVLSRTDVVSFLPFFDTLGDVSHPAARILEAFEYDGTGFLVSSTVAAIITMLQRNRYLRVLDLGFQRREYDMSVEEAHSMLAFHGQKLDGWRGSQAPGARARTVAFLSVLGSHSGVQHPGTSARHKLDANMVSLILQYAASEIRRCVRVAFTYN